MVRATFQERAERVLIAGMVIGIALIMQRFSIDLFRWGLSVLVVSTLLQIAVGNIPKSGSAAASVVRIVLILALVAAIFGLGVALVPTLAQLGR